MNEHLIYLIKLKSIRSLIGHEGQIAPSLAPILGMFFARFLSRVYSLRSRVRSDVHHFFAYGDSLAFGVSVCTASETTDVS